MTMLVGVFQMLLLILAASGLTKVAQPAQAGAAMISARLVPGPINRRFKTSQVIGRLLGLYEFVLATAAVAVPLLWPSATLAMVLALAVAGTFAGFNWFIGRLTSIDPGAGCGCFGDGTTPPGALHQAANWVAVLAASGIAVTIGVTGELPTATTHGITQTVPYLAAIAIGSALFLRGPALASEVQAAISADDHSHSHAQPFAISSNLLSQNVQLSEKARTSGRFSRGNRS